MSSDQSLWVTAIVFRKKWQVLTFYILVKSSALLDALPCSKDCNIIRRIIDSSISLNIIFHPHQTEKRS